MTPEEQEYQDYLDYQDYQSYQAKSVTAPKVDPEAAKEQEINKLLGEDASPSWQAARLAVGGLSKIVPYGDEIIAGGTALTEALPTWLGGTGESFGQAYDRRVDEIRGYQKAADKTAPIASTVTDIAGSVAVPMPGSIFSKARGVVPAVTNVAKGAAVGGAYGAASGFGKGEGGLENRIESAKQGAKTGAIFGAGGQALSEGVQGAANKLAPTFKEWSRKLELSAFGAGKAKINKAINRMPDVLDESGNFQNPISKSLQSFRAEGGGKSMDPQALYGELTDQIDNHSNKLNEILSEAQQAQKDPIIPAFDKTKSYIEGLAGTDKAKAAKIAEEEIANTLNNTDGSILSLQSEKEKLGSSIADGAWGQDSADKLRTNILKRIRADLRTSVEDGYQALTGKSSNAVKQLNQKIGERLTLKPVFKDMIATGEARDPAKWLVQNWRTSGGFGVPALITAGAVGGPAAAAVPLAGAALMTPSGRALLSKGFGVAGNVLPSVASGAQAASRESLKFVPSLISAPPPNTSPSSYSPTSEVKDLLSGQKYKRPPASRQTQGRQGQQAEKVLESFLNSTTSRSKLPSGLFGIGSEKQILKTFKDLQKNGGSQSDVDRAFKSLSSKDYLSNDFDRASLFDMPLEEALAMDVTDKAPTQLVQVLKDSVRKQESGGKADAVSPKGATGLYQIMPATGAEIAKELGIEKYDLKDPKTNEKFYEHYMGKLLKQFDNDPALALAAYNSGPGRVSRLLKQTGGSSFADIVDLLPKETQNYVPSILGRIKKGDVIKV